MTTSRAPAATTAGPARRTPPALGSTALLLSLSFIAGLVDVTSFVLLHGVFTAHITGNIVVIAADVATHRGVELISVVAVLVFIAVTAVLTAVVDVSQRAPYRWARAFVGLQFGLLAVVAVVAVAVQGAGQVKGPARLVIVVLAVAAMASQNALLHLTFKYAPSTAVMTGNVVASTAALVGIGLQWYRRKWAPAAAAASSGPDTDRVTWQRAWPTLAGFVLGCLLGAAVSDGLQWWAWVVPAVLSGLLAVRLSQTGLPVAIRRES